MSEDLEKQLAELHKLREKELLSEETYQAAVSRLRTAAGYAAQTTSGAVAQDHSTAVASRGVNVGGSVAGSIVTGDHNIVADRGATVGISGAELEKLFEPILAAVSAAPQAQQPAATQMANDLREEAAKGEEANDGLMAGLIRGLVGLVPARPRP